MLCLCAGPRPDAYSLYAEELVERFDRVWVEAAREKEPRYVEILALHGMLQHLQLDQHLLPAQRLLVKRHGKFSPAMLAPNMLQTGDEQMGDAACKSYQQHQCSQQPLSPVHILNLFIVCMQSLVLPSWCESGSSFSPTSSPQPLRVRRHCQCSRLQWMRWPSRFLTTMSRASQVR